MKKPGNKRFERMTRADTRIADEDLDLWPDDLDWRNVDHEGLSVDNRGGRQELLALFTSEDRS